MNNGSHAAISFAPDGAEEDRSRQPLSQLFGDLASRTSQDRLTISDLVALFQDRATLALLMIFGIFNVLPNPPGTSLILGLPMLYLSLAMLLDRQPWFPRIVMDRGIAQSMFGAVATRAVPILRRGEYLLHPRMAGLSQGWAFRLTGLFCLILSIILILPIPFGNMLPAACITLLAMTTAMRDGLWVLLGWVLSLACIVLMSGVVTAALFLAVRIVTGLLS